MHQCIHCQAELAENAQFCGRCGKSVEESETGSVDPATADTTVEATAESDAETTSKHAALSLSATPALPTLRTRRMHPQSSIQFPTDPWPAAETPEDETSATETAPAEGTAESALDTPAEQKAFEQIEQSEQSEQPEQAPAAPATGEDIDPISLSMTELAELATTPLDAPAAPASAAPESAPEQVESATGEVSTLSPVPQTPVPAEPASSASSGPLSPVPATPEPQAVDIADLPTGHIPLAAPAPMPEAESGEALPAQSIHAPLTPVPQTPLPDDSAPTPSSGPLSPIPQTPLPKEVVSASEAKTAPAPLPAPVRESTPRPQAIPPVAPGRAPRRRNTILLAALIIALVLVLGGAGTFLLLRPQAPASTAQCSAQQTSCVNGTPITIVKKPTSLTFSGAVAGPMTIVATPSCQSATSGNLHTLTVNLSGTINDKLYNFGFVIEHYNGPGTYSNATTSLLVLFAAPGDSTTNGWSNSDPTDTGSITIDKGEQTGSITYSLSGAGTNAKTQLQASGTWSCGK